MTPDSSAPSPASIPTVAEAYAVVSGHEAWNLRGLLERGFDVESRDAEGRTPVMWAALHGSMPALNLLLEKGASVTATDHDGNTALHHAASVQYSFREAIAKRLIEVGADIACTNDCGVTIRDLAAMNSRADVVKVLDETASARALAAVQLAEQQRAAAQAVHKAATMQGLRRHAAASLKPGRG